MKKAFYSFGLSFALLSVGAVAIAFTNSTQQINSISSFPYKQAGLTDREAAAHLLSRFTFGAKPGQVDEVVKTGLETWVAAQLQANLTDDALAKQLQNFDALNMSNAEIVKTFPRGGQALRMAVKEGVIDKDSAKTDKGEYRKQLKEYMDDKGLKPQAELLRQLAAQKVLTASYSNNQLREVMTDFWFNHFNVAVSKGDVQQYVLAYERDVIRPNVLGKFETLLLATAKSPAMLNYLDNNKSSVGADDMNTQQKQVARRREKVQEAVIEKMEDGEVKNQAKQRKGAQGLNENYAREIMELHTLGVDGGYLQTDVTQAAKVLTGWSINPAVDYNLNPRNTPNKERLQRLGFVYDGDFAFTATKHDYTEKKVLGATFAAGVGYEEGLKLIHLLATHPSTAKFIARKMAVRFVSDVPPQSIIDKMAKTFLDKDGDIKAVLMTMMNAPEFWTKEAVREKTKSPFEVTVSAVRATNAEVSAPFQLYQWTSKMGQRLYNYQAPTGFPDRGQYWINTGSLLNRMNFGLAFASGRIPGVKLNLLSLNGNHEPESAEQALTVYTRLLMPERDVAKTVERLTPLLTDPELQEKVESAADKTATSKAAMMDSGEEVMSKGQKGANKIGKKGNNVQVAMTNGNNSMLGQVVGIIIGSPEFQRR